MLVSDPVQPHGSNILQEQKIGWYRSNGSSSETYYQDPALKRQAEGKRGDEKKKIKYNVDCQGLEGGLLGSYCLMDAGFQFRNITRLLEVSR